MNIPAELLININTNELNVTSFDAESERKALHGRAYSLFRKAVDEIKIIKLSYLTTCATSFAKDSKVVVMSALQAHVELIKEGKIDKDTPFIVHSIDTGVENPLVVLNCLHSVRGLKKTCEALGVNLELNIGKPPLASQWAALYASGLKILCNAKSNSDCSIIMKIDTAAIVEKSLQEKYPNQEIVTLLGSRHQESARRSASVKKFTPSRTAEELIDNEQLVFCPIQDMSDDEVWSLIKMANPLGGRSMTQSEYDIMGYCSHTFLYHLYKDSSQKGACPTTAKTTQGESPGACGGSARTGCFVCLKSTRDKSGESAAQMARHRAYSLNSNKVRNWLQFISSDIQYRSFLSKAIDYSNGESICLQPNSPSGEILSTMIWYLSMLTFDEKKRAQEFKTLVENGRAHEDITISEIQSDDSLSAQDKSELIEVYTSFATQPLIEPINLELAVYLSGIHARDGIALPKFHGLMVYLAVQGGERIPYPNVDLDKMVESKIPDPIMAIPSVPFESYNPEFNSELSQLGFDREMNCQVQDTFVRTRFLERDVKRLLPEYLTQVNNGYLSVQGLVPVPLFSISGEASRQRKSRKERSERRLLRRKGKIERATSRVNSYAFKARPETSVLEESTSRTVMGFAPHHIKEPVLEAIEFSSMSDERFEVDLNQYFEIMQFELPRLRKQWRAEIKMNEELHGTMFIPSSTQAFNWLTETGILSLSRSAKLSSLRIMSRTNYFRSVGLHSLSNEQLVEMFHQRKAPKNTQIVSLMSMNEYRSFKAENLLEIRAKRSQSRQKVLKQQALRASDEATFQIELMNQMHANHGNYITESILDIVVSEILLRHGVKAFDERRFDLLKETSVAYLRMIKRHFTSSSVFSSYFRSDREYRCPVTETNLEQVGRDLFTQSVEDGFELVRQLGQKTNMCHSKLVVYRMLLESNTADIETELNKAVAWVRTLTEDAKTKASINFSGNLASIDWSNLRL
ncbi:adenine nucleotide alpha hydrolase family protein [Vibrio penaeicida]|uniref:Phosphoadenosine phosphosulphate reductase domain-containing protein n=1 Tax=Vibrio penaeicida TaxID=104609 RepID=A0AAV5NKK0_9VIBR|nr:hypothetical protein [Vibrio penaeicida]RTZ20312.1 hypothetical protein EKN09_24520 [Vibrio penaeicida]GLQ71151.1 hypothetical protein GCM10007932_05110 [Vibrio penaeicida]